MTQNELENILDVMESKKPKGIGVRSLSTLTGIDPQSLRKYLIKNNDYFVQLPESKTFTVNRYGKFKGSHSEMLSFHKQSLTNKSSSNFVLYFIIAVAATTSITFAVSNAT